MHAPALCNIVCSQLADYHKGSLRGEAYFKQCLSILTAGLLTQDVLPPDVPLISVSKGLELGSGKMMSEIIPAVLGRKHPAVFLSGPSFAREVMDRRPTGIVAAAKVSACFAWWWQVSLTLKALCMRLPLPGFLNKANLQVGCTRCSREYGNCCFEGLYLALCCNNNNHIFHPLLSRLPLALAEHQLIITVSYV